MGQKQIQSMQHEFSINNRTFLAVKTTYDCLGYTVNKYDDLNVLCAHDATGWNRIPLPDGEYKLIGLYPGMSEEVAAGIMPIQNPAAYMSAYQAYQDYTAKCRWYHTALESFASKMLAEKICLVNPLPIPECGREKVYTSSNTSAESQSYHIELHKRMQQWQEAEARTSRVWCILERI